MYLNKGVAFLYCFNELRGTPCTPEHPFSVRVSTIMGPLQQRFLLLLFHTGPAERKGQFLVTSYWQDWVVQPSRWQNFNKSKTKIRVDSLVDGLRVDGRVANRVLAVFIYLGVEGSDIYIAYLFPLPRHRM